LGCGLSRSGCSADRPQEGKSPEKGCAGGLARAEGPVVLGGRRLAELPSPAESS
jgi:hypothetical protein